jgi:hypothetical protein
MYERMTAIAVTPAWARMIDFETTLPRAVEQVLAGRG